MAPDHLERRDADRFRYLHGAEIRRNVQPFQKYQTSAFVCFTGNYNATENLLTGRYNDGVNWGSNYTYEVNGDKLTTTSETSTAEVSVYTKTTIPDEVRNAPVVRSEAAPADFERFL